MSLTLLIVGYGKMGRMVEEMAAGQDVEIVGRVDDGRDEWRPADVAVDFSTASALLANFPKYTQSKTNVVIGTTGWGEHAAKLRRDAEQAGLGVVAAPNFSIGVNIFQHVVAETARCQRPDATSSGIGKRNSSLALRHVSFSMTGSGRKPSCWCR